MALFKKKNTDPIDKVFDLHRTLPNQAYADAQPVKTKRAIPYKKIIKRTSLVLLVLLIIIGGYLGWKYYQNASRAFGGNPFDIFSNTKLKGESTGRVNILLVGYSNDDPGHSGAELTDSIMLISLDVNTKKAILVSIPRDLYVEIGDSYAKINEAYQDGERDNFSQAGLPSGGIGQLESIVSQKLQLPINYYAIINYSAFRDTVNAVGGVTVTIESTDSRGLFDPNIAIVDGGPLRLTNGVQNLNGQQALNLARARGDAYNSYGFPQSDFDRTANQRKLLIALKEKAATNTTIANPARIASLLDALGDNVKTDLTTAEARRLYTLSKDVPSTAITSANIRGTAPNLLLASYRTRTGQSALAPSAGLDDYSAIQAYIASLMTAN